MRALLEINRADSSPEMRSQTELQHAYYLSNNKHAYNHFGAYFWQSGDAAMRFTDKHFALIAT
jgi:hypothetical protein